MNGITAATALSEVVLDVLAGPYLLGYVIVGLGLFSSSGLIASLGALMIGVPLLVALGLALVTDA